MLKEPKEKFEKQQIEEKIAKNQQEMNDIDEKSRKTISI